MNEQVKSIDVEEVNVLSAVPKKKKHMSIGKRIAVGLGVAAIACSMALPVFATDPETSGSSATVNSVNNIIFQSRKRTCHNTVNS